MRIPGLKTLAHNVRRLRSRLVNGAVILGYHRVEEVPYDTYSMCVSPHHFFEQLGVLRRYAHPMRLDELVRGLREGDLPRGAVAITFDDGYPDVLHRAKPALEHYQIPATVFVSTGLLGHETWWDQLERLILSPRHLPERLPAAVVGRKDERRLNNLPDVDGSFDRKRLLKSLYRVLTPLTSDVRDKQMRALRKWANVASPEPPRCRLMTADELVQLNRGELVDIGAHTVTHPSLTEIPVAEQQREIRESKSCLEHILGGPVTSFSYPHGLVSRQAPAILRDSGFTCACSSHNDVAYKGTDPFHLPRLWASNWNAGTFSEWLAGWISRQNTDSA